MLLVGALPRFGSVAGWGFRVVACMGGCLGGDAKPPQLISQRTEQLHLESLKSYPVLRFLDNHTWEMDTSTMESYNSISSASTLIDVHDVHGTGSPTKKSAEFVNHGLILWNQNRQKWIEYKRTQNGSNQLLEPKLRTLSLCSTTKCWPWSWNANYKSVFSSNKPFQRHIPLAEMVDFLVEVWEEEGMYE